jgi:periplasmic protein TonB
MSQRNSSVGFIGLSAFLHGALLLGLIVVPTFKLWPGEKPETVEITMDSGDAGQIAAPVAVAAAPTQAAAVASAPAAPAPTVSAPTPHAPAPKKAKAAKRIIEVAMPAKAPKQSAPPEQEITSVVEDQTQAPDTEISSQDLKPVEPTPETPPAAEQLPSPEPEQPVARLSETKEAISNAETANDKGTTDAPSKSEVESVPSTTTGTSSPSSQNSSSSGSGSSPEDARSYLDLKQASGNPSPNYPMIARRQGRQGQVLLSYFVTAKGQVRDAKIVQSSGFADLDKSALQAISQFRYVAGQEGWTSHPVVFSLKGPEAPQPSRLRTATRNASNGE